MKSKYNDEAPGPNQRDFHALVQSFATLNHQYSQLRHAHDIFRKKYESDISLRNKQIQKLEQEKASLNAQLDSMDTVDKERCEKTEKKVTEKMNKIIEEIEREKAQLTVENAELEQKREELHRKLMEQTSQCRILTRECKIRERDLRNEYEEQISDLTSQLTAITKSTQPEKRSTIELDNLRNRYRSLDERFHEESEKMSKHMMEKEERIRELQENLLELTSQNEQYKMREMLIKSELMQQRRVVAERENSIEELRSELFELGKALLKRQRLELSPDAASVPMVLVQVLQFDSKLRHLEEVCAQKDQIIAESQQKLISAEKLLNSQQDSLKKAAKTNENLRHELKTVKRQLRSFELNRLLQKQQKVKELKHQNDKRMMNVTGAHTSGSCQGSNTGIPRYNTIPTAPFINYDSLSCITWNF